MAKVLLAGDHITDIYQFGEVSRLCPEAPVPVFTPGRIERREGGAGLVAANLRRFGLDVNARYCSESIKTRYFHGRHLLFRVDQDNCNAFYTGINPSLDGCDAVVVSDYNKGGITDSLARTLCQYTKVPVFVDTKRHQPDVYAGCFAIFPNQAEFPLLGDTAQYQHVVHKTGAEGCWLDDQLVPAERQEEYDVTGAGDIFLAAFVAAYLQGEPLQQCAYVANKAAAISVKHIGGYILTAADVASLRLSTGGCAQ